MSATHKYGPFFHQHTFTNKNKAIGKNILLRQSLNTFLLVFFYDSFVYIHIWWTTLHILLFRIGNDVKGFLLTLGVLPWESAELLWVSVRAHGRNTRNLANIWLRLTNNQPVVTAVGRLTKRVTFTTAHYRLCKPLRCQIDSKKGKPVTKLRTDRQESDCVRWIGNTTHVRSRWPFPCSQQE